MVVSLYNKNISSVYFIWFILCNLFIRNLLMCQICIVYNVHHICGCISVSIYRAMMAVLDLYVFFIYFIHLNFFNTIFLNRLSISDLIYSFYLYYLRLCRYMCSSFVPSVLFILYELLNRFQLIIRFIHFCHVICGYVGICIGLIWIYFIYGIDVYSFHRHCLIYFIFLIFFPMPNRAYYPCYAYYAVLVLSCCSFVLCWSRILLIRFFILLVSLCQVFNMHIINNIRGGVRQFIGSWWHSDI